MRRPRTNLYYLPHPTSDADLAVMRQLDELHLNYSFAGRRMLRDMLKLKDVKVGRQHVATLMAKMGKDEKVFLQHTSKGAKRRFPFSKSGARHF